MLLIESKVNDCKASEGESASNTREKDLDRCRRDQLQDALRDMERKKVQGEQKNMSITDPCKSYLSELGEGSSEE